MGRIKQTQLITRTEQQAGPFSNNKPHLKKKITVQSQRTDLGRACPPRFQGILGSRSVVVRQKVSRWKNNLAFLFKLWKLHIWWVYSSKVIHPLSTSAFPYMNQHSFCCVIYLFARRVHQRELPITTFQIVPNTSRQEVTAAITSVHLSLCRMLEDDLKISSDEEEAEQKVSSLCSSPILSSMQIAPCFRFPFVLQFLMNSRTSR